jgi:hypothetical protein
MIHRKEALKKKYKTIKAKKWGWYSPISIVGIGKSIMYILDNNDNKNLNIV